MHFKYLIIGAGPTGLGAGYRLQELGESSFVLLESNDYVGGLAASFKDSSGFTWDIGGHVMFSHYEYYDKLVEKALKGEYISHQRISRVRIADTWVPYPFQNNIRHLPKELCWQCVRGLLPENLPQDPPKNFEQWIRAVFGDGIASLFMLPYNFKVWATPASLMDFKWISERVSVVDLKRVLENLILEQDDVAWGPNNTFIFPLYGGTGSIFRGIAAFLKDFIRTDCRAVHIDQKTKTLRTAKGETFTYDYLLNTGPLDLLVTDILAEQNEQLRQAAGNLTHNGVFVSGVGIQPESGESPSDPTCWMYFPENNSPFYRLTNFHNYSPNNLAIPGQGRALMGEVSFSEHKQENFTSLMESTIQGLVNTGLVAESERKDIASTWSISVDYGYPVPTLERDAALRTLIPHLEGQDIYSRGRFGGWKYEISNMDHSVMQGVEWAERMVLGDQEKTYKVY